MTENVRPSAGLGTNPCGVCLTLDETAAVVRVHSTVSRELLAYFRENGVPCLQSEHSSETDAIDFGNPSPAEAKRIRALFESWRAGAGAQGDAGGGSVEWYIWCALVVIAVWLVAMFVL